MKTTNNAAAEIQYAMRDAHESMRFAMADNRWADVAKYAAELKALTAKHAHVTGHTYTISADGKTSRCG